MSTLKTLFISLLSVFAPIKATVIFVFVLILLDLITGIFAAKKRGEPITSVGLRRTVTKICIYEAVIIMAFLVQMHLVGVIPLVNIVNSFIGTTELTSLFENLNELSNQNLLSGLIGKLDSMNKGSNKNV